MGATWVARSRQPHLAGLWIRIVCQQSLRRSPLCPEIPITIFSCAMLPSMKNQVQSWTLQPKLRNIFVTEELIDSTEALSGMIGLVVAIQPSTLAEGLHNETKVWALLSPTAGYSDLPVSALMTHTRNQWLCYDWALESSSHEHRTQSLKVLSIMCAESTNNCRAHFCICKSAVHGRKGDRHIQLLAPFRTCHLRDSSTR